MESKVGNIFWDRIHARAVETVAAIREGRTPNIIRFAVHMTSRCNMKCRYCRETRTGPIMEREVFCQICQQAGKNGIIHITGGEPMVVPYLEDEIIAHRGLTNFALNSNLLVLPREKTMECIFRMKTSLDDYDGDRWNNLVGGNFFEKVVGNIRRASEAVPHTYVSYTATHLNAHRFKDFIRFCRAKFPHLFAVTCSFFKGAGEMCLQQHDIDILFEAAEELDDNSKELFVQTHTHQGNNFPENLQIPCYLSMTERLYDENGQQFYCSHLFRDMVTAPGNPGHDPHCVTGCNARFRNYNLKVHEALQSGKDIT